MERRFIIPDISLVGAFARWSNSSQLGLTIFLIGSPILSEVSMPLHPSLCIFSPRTGRKAPAWFQLQEPPASPPE